MTSYTLTYRVHGGFFSHEDVCMSVSGDRLAFVVSELGKFRYVRILSLTEDC